MKMVKGKLNVKYIEKEIFSQLGSLISAEKCALPSMKPDGSYMILIFSVLSIQNNNLKFHAYRLHVYLMSGSCHTT